MDGPRRRQTCRPLTQLLLFLTLFLAHIPPCDDAPASHLNLVNVTGRDSGLTKPTLDFRVLQEVPGEPREKTDWRSRRRRSSRGRKEEHCHHMGEERMVENAAVGRSQNGRPRPGTELIPVSQLHRAERVIRNAETRISTALPLRAEVCPHCREEDPSSQAEEDGKRCFEGRFTFSKIGSKLRFKACIAPLEYSCPFLPEEETGRFALSSSCLTTAKLDVEPAVASETTDPRCLIPTVHNSSFLAAYDTEFANSCHNFISKFQMLGEGRVEHGYVEQYYEHPAPLSTDDIQCLWMAERNGALYHIDQYLHMLSFNKSKTLPIVSVIIYDSPPKVPFHELAFLLLREEKYDCIKQLFGLVKSMVVGAFGSIYLTDEYEWSALYNCDHIRKTPFKYMWHKVITTSPARIVSVTQCSPYLNSDLTALLIQGPLKITSSTFHDLYERQVQQFSVKGQSVFVFEMALDILMGHILVTENKDTLNCTFHSRVTFCRGESARSPFTFMFIHNCSPPYFEKMPYYPSLFYALMLDAEIELNLCDAPHVFVPFYLDGEVYKSASFYLLDHGKNQSIKDSQVIHPFTYFRVYHLGSFIEGSYGRIFRIVEWKNPYLLFNENGINFRAILSYLENQFGVDELTLLTESKYKWSVYVNIRAAVSIINRWRASKCLDEMTRGINVIYEEDTNVYFTNAVKNRKLNVCYLTVFDRLFPMEHDWMRNKSTVNLFWPSCGNFHSAVVANETITSEWQYLSTGCRIIQILFLCITALITIVTIGGNLFVLYIIHKFRMWEIQRYGPAFFILRSLAIADLLSGLFPGTLAVWDQFSLMTGYMTLKDLDKDLFFEARQSFGGLHGKLKPIASLTDIRFERGGYAMFCAYVLSVSSIVSLLMLFLLSVERYRGVKNVSFPCIEVVVSVSMSWVIACVLGILLFVREDGYHASGYFDPISKLTVSTAQSQYSPSIIFFGLQVISVGGAGLLMIIITFYTFYTYIDKRKTRERTGVTAHPPEDVSMEDLKYFMIFFTMAFLYIVSSLPLAVLTVFALSQVVPLMQFITWWLFMAGGSWNWYLYTFRRGPFRRNLKSWKMRMKRRWEIQREFGQAVEWHRVVARFRDAN